MVIECKKCEGKGEVFDWPLIVFTLGMGFMTGKDRCNLCKGRGYRIFNTEITVNRDKNAE